MEFTIEQLMQYATEKGLRFEAYTVLDTETKLSKSWFGYTYGAGCWYWYTTLYNEPTEPCDSYTNNTYDFLHRYSQNTGRTSKGWKTKWAEGDKIKKQLKID